MAAEFPISKQEQRTVKQNIVIRARSIKVAGDGSSAADLPVSDKSYFSDRYDLNGERERLESVFERSPESVLLLPEEDEYEALQNYKTHVALLRRHIHRNHMNARARNTIKPEYVKLENYEIHLSEDESFGAIGRLTDEEQDFIELHTKDAVRLWTGKNEKALGNKRWAGIVYVIPLSIQIWNEARNGNPFAYAALLKIENELDGLIEHICKQTEVLQTQLEKIKSTGIYVSVRSNKDPIKIPVRVANLGLRLLKLLTVYDEFVRYCYTFSNKKIELDDEAADVLGVHTVNELKNSTSSNCRIFNQNVYNRAMSIRTLKETKCRCSDFLSDKDGVVGKQLGVAVAQNMVEPLTEEILTWRAKLHSGSLRNPFTPEATQQIIEYAYKYGLIVDGRHNVDGVDTENQSDSEKDNIGEAPAGAMENN